MFYPKMTYCPNLDRCSDVGCLKFTCAPIDQLDLTITSALHFIGFRGEEYNSAIKVFGNPDFIHKIWDIRAAIEISPIDTVIFAKYYNQLPTNYNFDDSNQIDDPASKERQETSKKY